MALPANTVRTIGALEFDIAPIIRGNYEDFFSKYDFYIQSIYDRPAERTYLFAQLIKIFIDFKVPASAILKYSKKANLLLEFAGPLIEHSLTADESLTTYLKMVLPVNRSGSDGYTNERLLQIYVSRCGKHKLAQREQLLAGVPQDYFKPEYNTLLFS